MTLTRRDFCISAAAAFGALKPTGASSQFQLKPGNEYLDRYEQNMFPEPGLSALMNQKSGQNFDPSEYESLLIYFATSQAIYGSCVSSILHMRSITQEITQFSITPVFVMHPIEMDDTSLLNRAKAGEFVILSHTNPKIVEDVARQHRAPYAWNEREQHFDHAQSATLVSQKGQLLATYRRADDVNFAFHLLQKQIFNAMNTRERIQHNLGL